MVANERMPYAPYPSPVGTAVAAPPLPVASANGSGPWFLARANLGVLIDVLREDGRTVIGPEGRGRGRGVRRDHDRRRPARRDRRLTVTGKYALVAKRDRRVFDYAVGPLSPKRWTFPPVVPLNVGRRDGRAVTFEPAAVDPPALAFLGVRACELAALGIQDRVFLGGPVHGPGLPRPAPQRPRHRGQLHHRGVDLLLHLDGHRPRGSWRLRHRAHRARRGLHGPRGFARGRRPRRSASRPRGRRRPDVPCGRGRRQGGGDAGRPGPDGGSP